jgi:hypothetical protein
MTPTHSGSMAANLGAKSRISNYRDGFAVAAAEMGYTRGSLKTKVYQQGGLLNELETICQRLVEAGQGVVAESIASRIARACDGRPKRPLLELLAEEQQLDGAEDEAELALAVEDSPGARDTYKRRLLRYRAICDDLLRSLEVA